MARKYVPLKDLYKEKEGEDVGNLVDSEAYLWSIFQVSYSKVSTKELKNTLLKSCHIYSSKYFNNEESRIKRDRPDFIKIRNAIKAELATREHLPNKSERKAIRQEKARKK